MEQSRREYLIGKFLQNTCTEAEKLELSAWVKESEDDTLSGLLEKAWDEFEPESGMPESVSERIIKNIIPDKYPEETEIRENTFLRRLWPKVAAAAALILTGGLYWWSASDPEKLTQQNTGSVQTADVPPGVKKAILTLGDGSSIALDSAGTGTLSSQGNTSVIKSGKGELIYESGKRTVQKTVYNTLTTPKGGQYSVVLPDGSKAWLNAASSLRFPTSFAGAERRVEITGEVYFEVAHQAKMPFNVKAYNTEISVLGTHFNIMAYDDENIQKTTLLEGSVKVSSQGKSALLIPGQQARVSSSSSSIQVINDIDTEKEMAWKNGYFQFEDESLESIMRQVSRWYGVDITYEGNVKKENFTGRLPRHANVSKVLKILALSGVKFRIEENRIIVTP